MVYYFLLELLTNATVVDDAIRFVSEHILDDKRRNNMDNNIALKEQEISENKSQLTNQIF
jgi:hypothetical protein